MASSQNQREIAIKHIPAITNDPDLSDEWHILQKNKTLGIMFSEQWGNRVAAGLELLQELAMDMGKPIDKAAAEILRYDGNKLANAIKPS